MCPYAMHLTNLLALPNRQTFVRDTFTQAAVDAQFCVGDAGIRTHALSSGIAYALVLSLEQQIGNRTDVVIGFRNRGL